MRQWSHVRMFSPWSYNVDKAAESCCGEQGWNSPDPDHYPTGGELVEHYLEPLATRTRLKEHVQTNSRVISVARVGFDKVKTAGRENAPFEIRYQNGKGPSTVRADAVIDASGTWGAPNPAGANGLEAIGEAEHAQRIAYGMPDVLGAERARYAGKVVAVLGAGHSAVGTILDLARLKQAEPRLKSSGCCAATIRRSRSAAGPMTSLPRAASSARSLLSLFGPAAFASKPGSASRISAALARN